MVTHDLANMLVFVIGPAILACALAYPIGIWMGRCGIDSILAAMVGALMPLIVMLVCMGYFVF